VKRSLEYAYRYLYSAGSAATLLGLAPFVPRHRPMLTQIANHFGYRAPGAPVPRLPEVELAELVPPSTPFQLREREAQLGNVTLVELLAISTVVAELRPRASFEIGTFNGRTAINIAANSAPGSVTFTLDLPQEEIENVKLPIEVADRAFVLKPVSGELIATAGAGLDIRQLYGDSARFDYAPYRGGMDFVFVDGAHSYEYVLNDSARALELLRDGRGVILWHDYDGWPGVTRGLNELYASGGPWRGLRRIRGTTLAYLRLP
jgi:predicted O-methyltransferase YrrM